MSDLKALNEFLRYFRLSLKRFLLYPEDHPSHGAFLLDFKDKLDLLLSSGKSFWLGVTSKSLRLEDGTWLTDKVHEELAKYLHNRRIQGLEFQPGLTEEELNNFLRFLTLSPKELLDRGAKPPSLEEPKFIHIKITWLDYSSLLSEEGEEIKEIWSYLLEQNLKNRKVEEIKQAASILIKALSKFSIKELATDEKEWSRWLDFYSLLKEKDTRLFKSAVMALIKNLLSHPEQMASPSQEEKFQGLFENFDEEILAACLAEIFRDDPAFDSSHLYLWFKLTRNKKHGLIATLIERNLETKLSQWPSSFLKDKFTRLIQGYSINPYPMPYYQAFLSLLRKVPEETQRQLDRSNLWKHELSLHFLLLRQEKKPERLFDSFNFLNRNLSRLMETEDFSQLKEFYEGMIERHNLLAGHEDYWPTLKRLTAFVEEKILKEEYFPEQEYFVANLKRSALGLNFYLQSIFGEGRISPAILKLFFRFFLDHLFYFDLNLDEKAKDKVFLEKMILALAEVDLPASFVTLKNIFNFSDSELRRKVLWAMQRLSMFDDAFLWPHLLERPLSWQREALLWLRKRPASLEKALKMLLGQPSPFGLRNKRLLEAARMVGEIGLKEALPYLRLLVNRPFIWNRKLRREVRQILESLNEG
ncbi:MAG: hypothetical protein N3B16_03170 [Candidatus Aminicenantes bacterium]|nr:hypothetical protein [Candidatus Aminicenantes bacterium]